MRIITYPPGWQNPLVLRPSAALAAAGAWDAAPVAFFATGSSFLTLSFTYINQNGGGAFDWQLEVSIYSAVGNVPAGASEWVTQSIYAAGAVAPGVDTASQIQREYQTYTATGVATEDFAFGPIALRRNIERIRVLARESGNVANPGVLSIAGELMLD